MLQPEEIQMWGKNKENSNIPENGTQEETDCFRNHKRELFYDKTQFQLNQLFFSALNQKKELVSQFNWNWNCSIQHVSHHVE